MLGDTLATGSAVVTAGVIVPVRLAVATVAAVVVTAGAALIPVGG